MAPKGNGRVSYFYDADVGSVYYSSGQYVSPPPRLSLRR